MLNLGTVKPGSTVRIPFSTFDKDDGSAITMTNFAAADILVYKDGSTTERASTAGFTATTDFDSKTGKHVAILDLADNTTANFWGAGSEYLVAIDAVTVDAVTTGGWIARFVIGYPDANLDTTIATLASQTSFTLTTGPAEDDALNGHWAIIHDLASAVQRATVRVLDYTGSTKTVTLAAGATFTAAAGDNFSLMDLAPLQPATTGRTLVVDANGLADANTVKIGPTGSGTAQTARDIGTSVLLSSGTGTGQVTLTSGRVNADLTHISAAAVSTSTAQLGVNVVNFGGSAGTFASGRPEVNTSHAAGTAWNSGAIGASTLASDTITAAKIAADAITDAKVASDVTIASVTGAVGSVTGAVGSVTGNVGGNVTGSVGSVASGGISEASFATTAGSFTPLGIIDQGTAQSATGTTLVLRSAAAFANDELLGAQILITGGSTGVGQTRTITDYVLSTDTATVDTWTTTPSGTITYKIFASSPALASFEAAIADAVWDEAISGHAVSGSTGEALSAAGAAGDPWITALPGSYSAGQAGYIIGTNVNATISSRASQTSLDTVDDFLDTEIAAIKTKTDYLPSATAGAAGGLFIAGTNAATTITTALTTTFTGNLTGSVGSVTGAVGSVTGAVGSVTGNVGGNVTGSVGSVATGGIVEASFATTAGSFAPLGIVDQGTAQSATGTTLVLRSAAAFADDELIGNILVITGGSAGVGQARAITDYVGSTDTATVDTWATTPTGTITYKILADKTAASGSGLDAAGVRAAIGMASANLDTQLDALPTAAENTTAVWAAGTRSLTVLDEDSTTLDLDATIRAAVGMSSANLDTQLTAIDDFLDTEVAAIKAKTDSLTFTVAGVVDANTTQWKGSTAPAMTGDAFARLGAPAGASVSADVAAVKAQTAAIETDTAEIGAAGAGLTVLATAASLATVDDFLDTEIAAIKAKTDSLTFTVSGQVDANIQYVNDTSVGGDGSPGTEWGP